MARDELEIRDEMERVLMLATEIMEIKSKLTGGAVDASVVFRAMPLLMKFESQLQGMYFAFAWSLREEDVPLHMIIDKVNEGVVQFKKEIGGS